LEWLLVQISICFIFHTLSFKSQAFIALIRYWVFWLIFFWFYWAIRIIYWIVNALIKIFLLFSYFILEFLKWFNLIMISCTLNEKLMNQFINLFIFFLDRNSWWTVMNPKSVHKMINRMSIDVKLMFIHLSTSPSIQLEDSFVLEYK